MDPLTFASAAPSLTPQDVERFSRQMMVEGVGAEGMARIRAARVACVGAGGLGSTIALYLAAAGVGTLTLIDFDDVELSNLHRQVIHITANIGRPKVTSAREACLAVFPDAQIVAIPEALTAQNALRLLQGHTVVLDGSDNVAARYLVNDAAMALAIPLVSGSAIRWDGQLSVYGAKGGPCYRCVFPEPPPAAAVGTCSDTGVVGPVPGLIGCMQAMEAIKLIADAGEVLSGRLFIFDGLRFSARVVKLRGKQPHCPACSHATEASSDALTQRSTVLAPARAEYVPASCPVGAAFSHALLPDPRTICVSVTAFAAAMRGPSIGPCVCVDVRAPIQFGMAHLSGSHNVPLSDLETWRADGSLRDKWETLVTRWWNSAQRPGQKRTTHPADAEVSAPVETAVCAVFLICRRGVASARATRLLLDAFSTEAGTADHLTFMTADGQVRYVVRNVDGGLNSFHTEVDRSFPYY